jgi:hypothetical protein
VDSIHPHALLALDDNYTMKVLDVLQREEAPWEEVEAEGHTYQLSPSSFSALFSLVPLLRRRGDV